jgi:HSP20 family protein
MALTPFFGGNGRNSILDPFDLAFWDPVDSWPSSFFGRNVGRDVQAVASTRIDWVETPEAHVFKADLPGLQKEDVKVTLEGDRTLQISGERTREEEKKTDTWHRVERSHGKFLRRFRLPENANVESVNAKVDKGVLTVTVPKTKRTEPEVRVVNIA